MADEADVTDPHIEDVISEGVERAADALKQRRSIEPIGQCHWCELEFPEEPAVDAAGDEQLVMSKKLFCGRECAADWEYDQKRKKEIGR